MGTSSPYSAPASWAGLKGEVTRAAAGALSRTSAAKIVRRYVRENGGAKEISRGRGTSVGSGRAAAAVARALGGFVSNVATVGLDEALRRARLDALIGRSAVEILDGLLDRLGGPASTIDEVDARNALASVRATILEDATTPAEIEAILVEQAASLENLLAQFIGFYVYEQFCRVFFERLVQRHGEAKAESFLDQIRDFIVSTLANRTPDRDLTKIAWDGTEGRNLIREIMETTLSIFETE